ncbi:MAG: glycosyltransferase family 4 protein [Hespellia sp.]|nr:glycosyltransferase family 4 protein [Hespellia sp.]
MKIAIATFADLPNPPSKGGAVESLIDDLCKINEKKNQLSLDVFSVYDSAAVELAKDYRNTEFIYYRRYKNRRISKKNIVHKLFDKSIPDRTMQELIKLINLNCYDYVLVTSINYEMEYIFQKINSRVIWYLHGDPISVLSREAIKRITNHCYAVITVSDFVNSRITSVDSKCKVMTIRNCTDLLPVQPKEEFAVRQEIRGEIGVRDSDKLFVYIGRITPIKGIYELVEAFVIANIKNTKLLIVGAPSDESEKIYLKKIKSIANQNVIYWGYAAHGSLNKLYCAADCIVAPSVCQEAALLIALEAAICHRFLIATKIGGIPEYADDNTILVEYNERFVNNLADAMQYICASAYHIVQKKIESNPVEKYYDDFCNVLLQFTKEDI